jgi:modification methylase
LALDILKALPSNIFDCGVTSPPYNKQEKHKGWLVKNVIYDKYKDVLPENDYQEDQIDVLNELYRVTKEGGHFFYNHKIRWDKVEMLHPMRWIAKTKWQIRQEIIWDRTIAANIRGWRFWQVEERIYWLCKPKDKNLIGKELMSKHALMTSIWRFRPEQKSKHPAPFPLELPLRCIYSVLDQKKDCRIIDPYCGGGTTLVAAKMLGHSYFGSDMSDEYIKMAKLRLDNCQDEQHKVKDEISKHIVIKTFTDRKIERAKRDASKKEKLMNDAPSQDLFSLL